MKSVNTDVAYDFVRKKILSGEYLPGRPLMTEELASEIGVSRTPVRDAFRKLEMDGLVTIRAHLGATVKKMEIKEFREMCDMRLALESHAAALAATNRSEADLQEIRFALAGMQRLTEQLAQVKEEQPHLNELVREDVRFHIAIMTAAKNDLMKKEILRLHLINRVVYGPAPTPTLPEGKVELNNRRRATLATHERIYQAIAKSEAEAARSEMTFHLKEMIDFTLQVMARAESGILARELTAEELAYNS